MNRFYITTPIYYVNAKPHLGHAYTTIMADCMKRFHLLQGEESFFLTGTDEHGDKIVKAATANEQTPKEYVDKISALFQNLLLATGAQNDHFIRTTDSKHKQTVQSILQKVYDNGDIYFGEYGGHYCFGCERFYTEKELVNGFCPDHKTVPEYISEKNYFFKMSKYHDWLVEYIKEHDDFITPVSYRNEVLASLELGASEDLCISRPKTRLEWGIELPFDSEYVTYVWFDALVNYISALGYPEDDSFQKFWPSAHHIIAKDILKPHAIFWPTILKSAGIEPYQGLHVHGYWLSNGSKMSKSVGNVVEPLAMIKKYGIDAFRYFLLREMVWGQDSSFSEELLVGRLNADLANDLGNLFSRTLSMTQKYFGGIVPVSLDEDLVDLEIKNLGRASMENFQKYMLEFQTARALESLWVLVRGLNKYIDTTKPWEVHKAQNEKRLGSIIYTLLESMRKLALHLWPIIPEAANMMFKQLGIAFAPEKFVLSKEADVWGILESGTTVAAESNLFPRVELVIEEKEENIAALEKKAVEFEDFEKLDLRVATVLAAQKHSDADRLLVVQLDIGQDEPRQIVAGIAEDFIPEALVGKQVLIVANLKPRKIRGKLSQGMILAAKDAEGLQLLSPFKQISAGAKVS